MLNYIKYLRGQMALTDARTIWLFQDNLIFKNLDEKLFDRFLTCLDEMGLFVNEGKIIDASFVEVPRQCNSKEKNAKIRQGNGASLWKANMIIRKNTPAIHSKFITV